jgi:hypothetical protein
LKGKAMTGKAMTGKTQTICFHAFWVRIDLEKTGMEKTAEAFKGWDLPSPL